MILVVLIICILWIILSIYKQFYPQQINRNIDPFALIPIWTLFSPKPIKNIYLLGYREFNTDESKLFIVNDFSSKWYYVFWLGQRRDVKFILGIKRQLNKCNNRSYLFLKTKSFKLIKNYILNHNRAGNFTLRQIFFLKKGGWFISTDDKVLFVTNIKKS